jgi:hypothetical protein
VTRIRRHRRLAEGCSAGRRRRFGWFGLSCSPARVRPISSNPAARSELPGSSGSVYVQASRYPRAVAARQRAPYSIEQPFLTPSVPIRAMLHRPVPSHTCGPDVTRPTPRRVPDWSTTDVAKRAPASSRRRWRCTVTHHLVASFTVTGRSQRRSVIGS